MKAALRVFADQGAAARLEDIAQTAGVSRQTVYVHFGSRAGLLVGMARYVDEKGDLEGHIRQIVDAPSALDALEIALAAPAAYYPLAYPLAKLFMAGRYGDEAIRTAWDDRMQARRDICGLLVRRLAEDGVLAPEWELDMAADVMWVWTSWQVWEQLVIDQGWTPERYTGHLRSVLLKLLVTSYR